MHQAITRIAKTWKKKSIFNLACLESRARLSISKKTGIFSLSDHQLAKNLILVLDLPKENIEISKNL